MIRWSRFILIVLSFGAVGVACRRSSGAGENRAKATKGAATETSTPKACGAALTGVPPPPPDSGQIVFSLSLTNADPCSVTGYVVGAPDTQVVQNAGGGVYYVAGTTGTVDLVVQASVPAAEPPPPPPPPPEDIAGFEPVPVALGDLLAQATPPALGLRINRISVTPGRDTVLPAGTTLLPLGSVAGVAKLEGQALHGGILVNVPGTRYAAFTADDGSYVLDGVVAGEHDLSFSHDQYLIYRLGLVEVNAAVQTGLPDVVLRINKGAAGPIVLDDVNVIGAMTDGTPISGDLTLGFTIVTSATPVKMKISHLTGCPNADYVPFATRGSLAVPATDALRNTGKDDVTLNVCLVDKDNTVSNLTQQVRVQVFGVERASITVPTKIDRAYAAVPVALDLAGVNTAGTTLELFAGGASAEARASAIASPEAHGLFQTTPGAASWLDLQGAPLCGEVAVYARFRTTRPEIGAITSPVTSVTLERLCWRNVSFLGRPDYAAPLAENAQPFWLGDRLALWGALPDVPDEELEFVIEDRTRAFNHIYDPIEGLWRSMTTVEPPKRAFDRDFGFFLDMGQLTMTDGRRLIVLGPGLTTPGGIYDAATDTWALIPTLAGGKADVMQWLDDRAFAWNMSGWEHPTNGTLYDREPAAAVYLPVANAWLPVSEVGMPSERLFASATWTGQKLVVFGGTAADGTAPTGPGAMYDPHADTWTALAASGAPSPRIEHLAVVADGSVYVLGGTDPGATEILLDGARFDPKTNAWTPIAALPESVATGIPAGVVAGRLVFWRVNLIYDPSTDRWTRIEEPPCAELPTGFNVFMDDRVVQWPSRCGLHEYHVASNSWSGWNLLPPELTETAMPLASILRAGSRFVVFERAGDVFGVGKAPAFIGSTGISPIDLAWLTPEGRRDPLVQPGETFGLGYRALNADLATTPGKLEVLAVRGPATIVAQDAVFPALAANAATDVDAADSVRLRVDGDGMTAGTIEVDVGFTTGEGITGKATAKLSVTRPALVVRGLLASPDLGPGETRTMRLAVANHGSVPLSSASVTTRAGTCLTSASGFTIGSLTPGETVEKTIEATASGACALGATATIGGFDVVYGDAFGAGRTATARGLSFTLGRYTHVIEESPQLTLEDDTSTDRFLAVPGSGTVQAVQVEVEMADTTSTSVIDLKLSEPSAVRSQTTRFGVTSQDGATQTFDYEDFAGSMANGTWTLTILNDSNAKNPVLKRVKLTIEAQR